MRRSTGLAIAAAVLSVTLGVLIGLVIHTGMAERADAGRDVRPDAIAAGLAASSAQHGSAAGSAAGSLEWDPATGGPVTPSGQPIPTGDATQSSGATPSGGGGDHPTAPPSTAPASTAPDTVTPPDPDTSAGPSAPTTLSVTTASGRPSTSATASTARPPIESPTPGGPCRTLGAKTAMVGGATLFCQRHQTDHSLRWRAVTDGGGCLNRTMTGVGLDGRHYACHRGAKGLNHWTPVG